MKICLAPMAAFVMLAGLSGPLVADDTAVAPSAAAIAFSELPRDAFLDGLETRSEAIWADTVLLYTRIDPELGPFVPGKSWDDEDRQVMGCVYDRFAATDQLANFAASIEQQETMARMIVDTPDMTLLTMSDYDVMTDTPALDGAMEVMTDCGQMDLVARRMGEAGLWDKLSKVMAE